MTREEAEALIRSVRRACKGKPLLSDEARGRFWAVWNAIEAVRSFPLGVAFMKRLAVLLKVEVPVVPEGNFEELHKEIIGLICACEDRVGKLCGADFNEVVLAGPLDGEQHDYICPRCKVHSVYVAPKFDVEVTA
jgi:hypothetical protein